MPERFVVDASVTLAWLFDEGSNVQRTAAKLRDGNPVVPALWRLEVVNVILVKERRKLLTIAEASHLLEVLEDWAKEVIEEPSRRSLQALASLARPYQLSTYDAVYLDAAMSLNLPLFTNDGNLRAAAARVGVALL